MIMNLQNKVTLFKLRLGASYERLVCLSVGWSVSRWVCLKHKIRTKIQDERTAVKHQVKNKSHSAVGVDLKTVFEHYPNPKNNQF